MGKQSATGAIQPFSANPDASNSKGGEIRGQIPSLLVGGYSLQKVARKLGLSYKQVRAAAQKYERAGLIERTTRRPGIYRWKKSILTPLKGVGELDALGASTYSKGGANEGNKPLLLPAKFGATFHLQNRPAVKYDERGKFTDATRARTIQLGRYKMVIWLHSFVGSTVEEINSMGQAAIVGLAQAAGKKYGFEFALDRFFYDVEWVVLSKQDGLNMARAVGIEKGGAIECDGAIHKFDDFSDPETWQFNPERGKDPRRPTDHARIHENIYSGHLHRDIIDLKEVLEMEVLARMEERRARFTDVMRGGDFPMVEEGSFLPWRAKSGKSAPFDLSGLLPQGGSDCRFTASVLGLAPRAGRCISPSNWRRWTAGRC